jgi:preprotein translocase subunit YajC
MELLADVIVFLFWLLFFSATFLGVYDEYRRGKQQQAQRQATHKSLHDDDPVYLIDPQLHDSIA